MRTLPLSLGVVVVVVVLLVAELTLVVEDGVSADPSEVLEACRRTPPPALGLRSRIAGAGCGTAEVDDWPPPLPMLVALVPGASFRKDCLRERLSQFFTLVVRVSRLGRGSGDELITPP